MKFVLVNGRYRVQSLSAHCAASPSAKATCESLPLVSPTAITTATPVTAKSRSQSSKNVRGHHDNNSEYYGPCERRRADASSLRSLRRSIRDGDPPLVGQQVLQAQVQLREITLDQDAVHRLCGWLGVISPFDPHWNKRGAVLRPCRATQPSIAWCKRRPAV
jgi:hypothetical protein